MYQSDLDDVSNKFRVIKDKYSELTALKEAWSKTKNEELLSKFDFLKRKIPSLINELFNRVKGLLQIATLEYEKEKRFTEKNSLLVQKKTLENMRNELTRIRMSIANTEIIRNPTSQEGTADPGLVAKILSSLGNLEAALRMFHIGPAQVLIEDEHMEPRWERTQEDFVEAYSALDRIREKLSPAQLRALSIFTEKYFDAMRKIELRKTINEFLGPIIEKIAQVNSALKTLPNPAQLELVKNRNPEVYAQVMTLEKAVMDPLAINITKFLKEYKDFLPDRIKNFLEEWLKTLRSYIKGFE